MHRAKGARVRCRQVRQARASKSQPRTTARYCELTRQEQQRQQDLLKRIQELESGIANKHEEEEVRNEFKNRDKLRQSLMHWNDFEEDFEEYDEMTEADQLVKIDKMENLLKQRAMEIEDIEKENLDSRMVMMSEYKEQLKMIDFFKELIHTQISKGELEQLRLQSKWSDKDVEYKVPVFYAKNGRVNPVKLPKHELILKLTELQEARTLKLKTDHLVQKITMSLNLDDDDMPPVDEDLYKNQVLDASFYKSKSHIEAPLLQSKVANNVRPFQKQKQMRLPPISHDN